jgi:FAD/FMN-containing dehydrogenase/Fe-S oxidoreductase
MSRRTGPAAAGSASSTTLAGVTVEADALTRAVYATDNSIYQVEPGAVVLPRSAEEIQAVVAASDQPITARGGGTGTNGQSLTQGLVLDVKRHLNRLVSLDVEARTAVVEPGLVTARLNQQLAAHGLVWAPHTSTLNRATVGGMISTDAAGKGSLIHGRAHRHVQALDVVLDDGSPWRAEACPVAEAEARAARDGRGGQLWRALLDLPLTEGAEYGLPELARGFSGYGIDRVRRHGLVDPVPLLCGAEGTLAVITSATISLTPLPARTLLVVAGYDSFADALDDAVDLAATRPAAIECSDETTLAQGRSSPAWPVLAGLLGDHHGSVLLLEYSGPEDPDPEPVRAALAATGRSRTVVTTTDRTERAAAWKVREDAVGLLAKVRVGEPARSARPTAFVEDCAVPVAAMAPFIGGFRAVLDQFGLTYAMFGHADVGCVHVRPALDLTDPEHERLIRAVTAEVVALVARHGGVLWGEHGRGYRGDAVESFLSPETIGVMRAVKTAFDPGNRFNPGKLYAPLTPGTRPITAVDAAPLRGQADRSVPVAVRRRYGHAFACNGNGLCHHHDGAEVMCPSYKVTGDPALSPRGRADLIRAWLARVERSAPDLAAFEQGLAANLHQCLSCSACTGHCPVEVDIPDLKSRFLERYHQRRRRPVSHRVLGRFESVAPLLAKVPPVLARLGTAPAGRMLGLVDLPAPGPRPRGVLPGFEPANPTELVILPDVFTASLEPETLHQAVAVLAGTGASVSVAPFVPSGKFDHVKGRRAAFARSARAQAALVGRITAAGAVPVVIEPAVALLHRHEYPAIHPGHPGASAVRLLSEVLDERPAQPAGDGEPGRRGPVSLLGHCTERATAPGSLAAWGRVLTAAGFTVTVPDLGCCGMAGIFGHEVANQAMSRALWDLTWAGPVADAAIGGSLAVATGYSCRAQAKRFGPVAIRHPVHLLGGS